MGEGSQAGKFVVPAIVLLSALAVGVGIISLCLGYPYVFQNLFYFPIILVCVWFPRKGLPITGLLSLIYIAMILLLHDSRSEVIPALIRIAFFLLVGAVIVYQSKRCRSQESQLLAHQESLKKTIEEQTERIHQELDQSHRMEKAYKDTCGHYELILESLKTPLAILNTDLYITNTNAAFEKLTGYPRSELRGRKLSTVLQIEDASIREFGRDSGQELAHKAQVRWIFTGVSEAEGVNGFYLVEGRKQE